MINFINFTLLIFTYLLKNFPQTPLSSMSRLYSLFFDSAARKFKKFLEKFAFFSRISSINIQNSINRNAYFWKITLNFRVLPNSKISFRPSKIGPQKHLMDPAQPENLAWITGIGCFSHKSFYLAYRIVLSLNFCKPTTKFQINDTLPQN